MAYVNPSVADFKIYFNRDFPYGVALSTVTDTDIFNAYQTTIANLNPALFAGQADYTIGFLLLSAHFLVIALQSSSQGVAGQFDWLTVSKGVGNVNESFQIPQRILDNPEYAILSMTNYGARYLAMILPNLSGQMFAVCARTNP